jgi:hypothetical protein
MIWVRLKFRGWTDYSHDLHSVTYIRKNHRRKCSPTEVYKHSSRFQQCKAVCQGHLANSDTAQVTPIAPATTTTTTTTPTVPQEDAAKLPDYHGKSKDCVTTGDDVCLKGSYAHECECDGPHDPNCQNSPKFIYARR